MVTFKWAVYKSYHKRIDATLLFNESDGFNELGTLNPNPHLINVVYGLTCL